MSGFRVGDEVLAPWMNDGFLYPAVLVKLEGEAAHVAYLDGAAADHPVTALRLGAFGPGLAVSVDWRGQKRYYPGTIVGRVGQALDIAYDDGSREWSVVGKCRLPIAALAALSLQHVACSYCGNAMQATSIKCDTCGASRPGR